MNARYYDPETGRFISQDTYRGTGEAFWHLYLYCDDDPVNHIDPSGHWIVDAIFLAGDVGSFIKKPSLGKALWIVADLLCFIDATGAASTVLHAAKFIKVMKVSKIIKSSKIVKAAKAVKNVAKETKIVKGATKATGQIHHLLSNKIMKALNTHPTLKGKFNRENPMFKYKAADAEAHKGYQQWHRGIDDEVVGWLQKNPDATTKEFKKLLNSIYKRADIRKKIPNVNIK